MKDPQYIPQLNATASLADVITKVNTIIDDINYMWNPQDSGSLE
jgi:hypothetical protein